MAYFTSVLVEISSKYIKCLEATELQIEELAIFLESVCQYDFPVFSLSLPVSKLTF